MSFAVRTTTDFMMSPFFTRPRGIASFTPHAASRKRLLRRPHDDVADGRVLALRAAQNLDAHHAPRAGIVGDVEIRLHLDHGLDPFLVSERFPARRTTPEGDLSSPCPCSRPATAPVRPAGPFTSARRSRPVVSRGEKRSYRALPLPAQPLSSALVGQADEGLDLLDQTSAAGGGLRVGDELPG